VIGSVHLLIGEGEIMGKYNRGKFTSIILKREVLRKLDKIIAVGEARSDAIARILNHFLVCGVAPYLTFVKRAATQAQASGQGYFAYIGV